VFSLLGGSLIKRYLMKGPSERSCRGEKPYYLYYKGETILQILWLFLGEAVFAQKEKSPTKQGLNMEICWGTSISNRKILLMFFALE
jgi:hypothetical protein